MLMLADCWFATQIRPSGATATLRGRCPTATSAILTSVSASNTVAVSLSGLTFQTRSRLPS